MSLSVRILSLLILSLFCGFINDEQPKIVWDKTEINFGNIQEGEIKHGSFTCYNHSDTDLIFENVLPSCGCVVPHWPKEAIKAGDSTRIEFDFNSSGKSKQHLKTIAVYTNQGLYELFVKVNINSK